MTADSTTRSAAKRVPATVFAVLGSIVWTHALAGVVRATADLPVADLAPASSGLTLAAIATAVFASFGFASVVRAAGLALAGGWISATIVAVLHPAAMLPALAVIPVGAGFAAFGAWIERSIPESWGELASRRPKLTLAWLAVVLVAIVQVGRLATHMTDTESDWFVSTRHPFYAKHECANAYFYAAELNRNGEPNVYDASHYPGLDPKAKPTTEITGMNPEDPFQYAPQFLLWPRLAIALTSDYAAIRALWFGVNVTLCMAAVLLLAMWVGGRVGTIAGLLSPAVLASFPVLHDFQYGQFHFATIALAVLAMLAFQRRRSALGGSLLAVSILSKLFPALLLGVLAAQKRWRDLAWTAVAGVVLTAVSVAVVGTSPFVAFFDYQVPRLADGSAFAFGEAWPDLASLVTAGNQGVYGIVHKLDALGVPGMDAAVANSLGRGFGLVLLLLSVFVGVRTAAAGRKQRAVAWLGLLGLGSLAGAGAWADYVPLTCVWLLAFVAPMVSGRRVALAAVGVCAVMQVFLLGAVPLGPWTGASWMIPVSLFGAVSMFLAFGSAMVPLLGAASSDVPAVAGVVEDQPAS